MISRNWDEVDFVYVSGDAYVDHPSFGASIITRVLENEGYKVGVISQPNWKNNVSFKVFGKPRLGFFVSSGNIDSMVNHYTVAKKRRKKDYYTPNGEMGKRPDRAVIRYCNKLRELYPESAIITGGVEASLRRLSHYDYWDNRVMKSILLDSKADLVLYGMGEKTIVQVADALDAGINVSDIVYIRNSVWKTKDLERLSFEYQMLPSYKEVISDKKKYLESFRIQYKNTDAFTAKSIVEDYGDIFVVQNPPQEPLTVEEIDFTYSLPYMRTYHPSYEEAGGVPAISEVKFSIISNRGCFGGCSFCALTFHQGRIIQTRSHESIIEEAKIVTQDPEFKGYINDEELLNTANELKKTDYGQYLFNLVKK